MSFTIRLPHLILGLLALIASFQTVIAIAFPLRWRWSNPMPHGANILDMAYSTNGIAVQVGERGQIFTSVDFETWIPRNSGTDRSLRGVAFLGSRIVICGERGAILVADDPSRFALVDLAIPDWLESVAASTNLLVAVGDNAAIFTSADAVTWRRQTVPFTHWLRGVAWGPPGFVAVGENGFIATSPTGTNWNVRASGVSQHLNRVTWAGDRFCAVGEAGTVLTSETGISWSSQNSGAARSLFASAGLPASQLVAGEKEVWLRDGSTWTNQLGDGQLYPPPAWDYYATLWDGAAFWLGGASGMLVQGYKTNLTSQTVWAEAGDSVRDWLWTLVRTPDFYLAAGNRATVMSSGNGVDWTPLIVPNSVTNETFLGIGAAGNQLFVVGTSGAMLRSTNGVTWDAITPRPTTNDLQGFTIRGNLYLASGGRGTILSSADGTAWRPQVTGTTNFLSGLETFPGGFVATGDNGTILTSSDGTNWTLRTSGATNWLYRVHHLNGVLLAVGENGTMRTSTDGFKWTVIPSGTSEWLTDAAFCDGAWYVVGTGGTVLVSTNLATWTSVGTLTRKSLFGLAASPSQLVAVGVEGAILRAQIVPDATPISFLKFQRRGEYNLFLFGGKPDQRFRLEQSSDLLNWSPGQDLDFLDGTGTLILLDQRPHEAMEFYRGRWLP